MRKSLKRHIFKIAFVFYILILIIILYFLFSQVIYIKKSEEIINNNLVTSNEDNNEEQDFENFIEVAAENQSTDGQATMYQTASGDTYSIVGTIIIDKININLHILSKFTYEILKVSVCRLWGPEHPNEIGNFCIVGHNYRNTKSFSKLSELEIGDTFEILDTNQKSVKYKIYDKNIVDPTDVSSLEQDTDGKMIVTLITCTNDSKQRYIIKAEAI